MRTGIDLGGTKIEIAVFDELGQMRLRTRIATPAGDYPGTLGAIRDLIGRAEGELGTHLPRIGVGIPGTLSPATGLVKNANSTCLIGRPLDADLERILGRPVRLANDADCFAVSEAKDGAGQGYESVFGVILGTGVGGGLVARGRLIRGPNGIAGEWGHNPLPWPRPDELPGSPCYCGKRGCIETFLSGPALARQDGRGRDAREVVLLAESADLVARYCERLARALASVINLFDPHAIVLGGGLSNLDLLYAEVPRLWGAWVFSDRVDTCLLRNRHGDSSGVRGAAWLWD